MTQAWSNPTLKSSSNLDYFGYLEFQCIIYIFKKNIYYYDILKGKKNYF